MDKDEQILKLFYALDCLVEECSNTATEFPEFQSEIDALSNAIEVLKEIKIVFLLNKRSISS